MSMLISIIVPIYNADKYLSRCVDSILEQSYSHFELLLIDDGSTDNSASICDQYAQQDARISVVHQTNAGVSQARNAGLNLAQGEYVTFIDADDTVSPTYLTDFHPYLADLSIQGVILHGKGEKISCQSFTSSLIAQGKTFKQAFVEAEITSNTKGPVAKLFKRSIIDTYHLAFDPRYSYGEDHLFVLEFIKHCQTVAVIDKCNYTYYLQNENSLTNKHLPYQPLANYAREAYQLRQNLIVQLGIVDKRYDQFILEERAHLIYQSIYSLYTFKGNHAKAERLAFIESVYNLDRNIVITATQLPLIFRLMKQVLQWKNRNLIDTSLLILSRGKECIKRII